MTGKRRVLRTGFGVIVGLLVLATYTAYRIQDSFSRRTVAIHHRFVQQQTLLTNLRRCLYGGGIAARDFFLNESPNRRSVYLTQLDAFQRDAGQSFVDLAKLLEPQNSVLELRARFDELWRVLHQSADMALPGSQEYGFVQKQIVPRRDAAATILRQLETANESNLTASEEEFTASRRSAAQSLLMMLFAGLGIGIFVMRFSLRHAEILENQAEQQFKEVSEAKTELERLSARLMEIQEEERTNLSRELHDEVVQNLAVLKIEIIQAQTKAGDRVTFAENLSRARDLAERTVKTTRNIMLLLRPSLLDDLGLGPALQWLTDDFKQRTGTRCDLAETGLQEDLPDAVKTCVFRVTQEALHNCEKHANASHVAVRVFQTASRLTLEVEDDGVGLDAIRQRNQTTANMHFGVIGMRERAASLGGTLTIDSKRGRGAKVSLTVPLPSPSPVQNRGTEVHV